MSGFSLDKYNELVSRLEELSRLGAVMGVLHWDQEVILPKGAVESRAKQMAAMAGIMHEKGTHAELGELLETLHSCGASAYDPLQWCNISEAKRDYDLSVKIPKDLVQELAELGARGHQVWAQAREDNKFSDFAPTLKRFVELKTRWAQCAFPELSPYDANIDIFERGMTVDKLTPIFDRVKTELKILIQRIKENPRQSDESFMQGSFSVEKQTALGKRISTAMGFSFDHGRMDVSVHPFCGGAGADDVRITTRYREDNFVESLYAVIHETGHGLYEQGRMQEHRDLPVSESLTMGIHESQSLFWERMIAQGKPFCDAFLPTIQEFFPENLGGVAPQSFFEAVNACSPSLIRVEADEATYPLHVILRFEIEKGLFDGSLAVDDLPEVWNQKMEDYLGIRPPSDTLGVLQDVHWSGGAFGYFPSYTLGAMYACQFYAALLKELPEIESEISKGNLAPVKAWLNEKIHSKGRLLSPDELIQNVTSSPLDPEVFIDYLKRKYEALYGLK